MISSGGGASPIGPSSAVALVISPFAALEYRVDDNELLEFVENQGAYSAISTYKRPEAQCSDFG